jgi:5-hydroxyisourate hydrolase-like protein (transthyretin family)
MKLLYSILALLICQHALSQNLEVKFGHPTQEEIDMKSYEKDRTAGAVVLFDIGKSEFFYVKGEGYDIRFTRHKRIKIFDKTEIDQSEISIPFYEGENGSIEKIVSIEALTYNMENGEVKKQKLDPTTVYDEKLNENWWNRKFVFPNVQEGSILELRYVLETPFHFNLPDWEFQDNIPTLYSEYQVGMIPFYEYVFIAQGISAFDFQESKVSDKKRHWGSSTKIKGQTVGNGIEFQDYVHTYVLKDVPAFKDVSYISSVNDYIQKMDFQLAKYNSPTGAEREILSTWPKLNEALLKSSNFGKYQKSIQKYAKTELEQNFDLTDKTDLEKSQLITDYVKKKYAWNGYKTKYAHQTVKEFSTSKSGNSAEINFYLIAMLNSAGVEAYPFILSTRDHGKINGNYPFDHMTNYVIAYVKTESPFFADATEQLLPYNQLPFRCMNEKGLVISKNGKDKWIHFENQSPSIVKNRIRIKFDSDLEHSEMDVSLSGMDYEGYALRSNFKNDTTAIKEYYSDKAGDIQKLRTRGYTDIEGPYTIAFKANEELDRIGDNLIVNPFVNLSVSENKLKQKQRNYPVDILHPTNTQFNITIDIPKGYEASEIPKEYSTDNELVQISLKYTEQGNVLNIEGNYQLKKAVYSPEEYPRLKNYMSIITKRFNAPLVLSKSIDSAMN